MNMIPFLIVADRGALKSFQIEKDQGRKPYPRLLEAEQVDEVRGRLQDKVTDQAGAFPNGGTAGQGNAIAERLSLHAEFQNRSFRHIAHRMVEMLREHKPERWAFAAPAEINEAILSGLPSDLRSRLILNVPRDLVNTPSDKLLAHFA